MTALHLPAVLTMSDARQVLSQLLAQLATEQPTSDVVLDACALRTLDTASLAVLLQCQRSCADAGGHLRITGAPDKLVQLARLYGVQALLGLEPQPA
jgi:phospholipid transport system transporter-binding protein